jgi:phage shock protein C
MSSTKSASKPDNLLGICNALGEDFGFDPLYLRIALAVGMLFSPVAMFGIYGAMGIIVLASRLIAPNPRRKAEVVHLQPAPAPRQLAHAA